MRVTLLFALLVGLAIGCDDGSAPADPPLTSTASPDVPRNQQVDAKVNQAGMSGASAPAHMPPSPVLLPNAPQDQPVDASGAEEVNEFQAAIAPYVEQARSTYPDAKKRYLAGLPTGHHFFAVTRLSDGSGAFEQVFISVASIKDGMITGRIASDIVAVSGYKNGDPFTFSESELIDWLIARPDGSEEGNVVGKFLDEWQKTRLQK